MKRRWKTQKTYITHPASVRAIFRKAGLEVGHWSANGRITGMSDFHGGNIEVSEYQENFKNKIISEYSGVQYCDVYAIVKAPKTMAEDIEKALENCEYNKHEHDNLNSIEYTIIKINKGE